MPLIPLNLLKGYAGMDSTADTVQSLLGISSDQISIIGVVWWTTNKRPKFADDIALFTESEAKMKELLEL